MGPSDRSGNLTQLIHRIVADAGLPIPDGRPFHNYPFLQRPLPLKASGLLWNRSLIELTKIIRGRRQAIGWSSRSGRSVRSKPRSNGHPFRHSSGRTRR